MNNPKRGPGRPPKAAPAPPLQPEPERKCRILYSRSPGLTLMMRPGPKHSIPVKDPRTGIFEQVQVPSIKATFSKNGFVAKQMKTKGPDGQPITYKGLRNCGKLNFDQWFDDKRLMFGLEEEDRERMWDFVTGPTARGFGKGYGTEEMIERLGWGAQPEKNIQTGMSV